MKQKNGNDTFDKLRTEQFSWLRRNFFQGLFVDDTWSGLWREQYWLWKVLTWQQQLGSSGGVLA